MKTLSVIRLMPATKQQIEYFVEQSVAQILSGENDGKEIAIYLKAMEEVIKKIRDNQDIKDMLIDEIGDKYENDNAKISVVSTSKYDYSEDEKWNELSKEIKLKTEIRKGREKLLQNLETEVADPDSGELIKPAAKTTTETIRVTLK